MTSINRIIAGKRYEVIVNGVIEKASIKDNNYLSVEYTPAIVTGKQIGRAHV